MTREDLRGIIEGISDEQLKAVLDINSTDIGKAKANFEGIKADLDTAKAKIEEYEGKIQELENSREDSEALKKQISELQGDIAARKEADELAEKETLLKNRFSAVCGEAKFLNDFTRDGVFAEFKSALADEKTNAGKSDADIYKAITDGKDNIFIPDGGLPDMSAAGSSVSYGTDASVREIMGLPPLTK